jgi:hypothetical protein
MKRWLKSLGTSALVAAALTVPVLPAHAQTDPRSDEKTVKILVKVIQNADAPISKRTEACLKLAEYGPAAQAALPALKDAVRYKRKIPVTGVHSECRLSSDRYYTYNVDVPDQRDLGLEFRRAALVALRAIGPEAREATPQLLEALKGLPDDKYDETLHHQEEFCRDLVRLLATLGPLDKDAAPVLLDVLKGELHGTDKKKPGVFSCNPEAREAAAEALGQLEVAPEEVTDALIEMQLLDPNEQIKAAAEKALDALAAKGAASAKPSETPIPGRPSR